MINIAEELYTAYWYSVKGTDINGNALPTWSQLLTDESRVKRKEAWERVASRAEQLLKD